MADPPACTGVAAVGRQGRRGVGNRRLCSGFAVPALLGHSSATERRAVHRLGSPGGRRRDDGLDSRSEPVRVIAVQERRSRRWSLSFPSILATSLFVRTIGDAVDVIVIRARGLRCAISRSWSLETACTLVVCWHWRGLLIVLLLRLAFRNHRSADRSARSHLRNKCWRSPATSLPLAVLIRAQAVAYLRSLPLSAAPRRRRSRGRRRARLADSGRCATPRSARSAPACPWRSPGRLPRRLRARGR